MELDSIIIEEARIGMQARILRCPLGGNPADCPLHEIRKWPMEKRLSWLETLNDEEIVELYRQHSDCLEIKLEESNRI